MQIAAEVAQPGVAASEIARLLRVTPQQVFDLRCYAGKVAACDDQAGEGCLRTDRARRQFASRGPGVPASAADGG